LQLPQYSVSLRNDLSFRLINIQLLVNHDQKSEVYKFSSFYLNLIMFSFLNPVFNTAVFFSWSNF
jgi:hypothetical protein